MAGCAISLRQLCILSAESLTSLDGMDSARGRRIKQQAGSLQESIRKCGVQGEIWC